MKSTLSLSLGLILSSVSTVLASKDVSSDRLIRRHSAVRPRQYGGAGAAYGGGGGADTGSAMASDMVSSPAMDTSSSEMMASESMMDSATVSGWSETSTAMAEQPASTWSAASASASSGWQYGSGSYGKNQGSYDDCVQQCQAKYAAAPTWAATATAASVSDSYASPAASATGAYASPPALNGTALIAGPGQVVVAPMKGDLRMVPFNINIKKGDKVKWIWGAGPHTVTKSSLGSICNKTMDAPFASGQQNASFEFETVVDDDQNPTPFFCGVPTHCQKGMFGLINGIVSTDPAKGYGKWMEGHAKNDSKFATMWAETQKIVQGTTAENWGAMLDYTSMPDWAHPYAAESIMMTRQFYAANPSILAANTAGSNSSLSSNAGPASPTNSGSMSSSSMDPNSTSSADIGAPSAAGLTAGSSSLVASGAGVVLAALLSAVLS